MAVDRADGLVAEEVVRSLILAGAERVKGQLCRCRRLSPHAAVIVT